jgi:hypothetical protein
MQEVIQNTDEDEWKSMKDSAIDRAQTFSLEKFEEKLQSAICI